ncbi:hypothetical protein [Microcoleus sp. OTE_8_concoct_300]|uniref:hypothetical protein n=1 Tax=Microcoleus sp. OTE_8_concoct_300 TaxID=2964710 RepID=UPI00403F1F3B
MKLVEKILKYMEAKKYEVATGAGEKNIIYIEGMNSDGTLNADTPNHFNDLRLILAFHEGVPKIEGSWEATTEPGYYYPYSAPPRGSVRGLRK